MEYVPLKITTVQPNTALTFDLYIYFKEHYLCYTPKGNTIEEDKLEKLVTQEITDFFIPQDQIDNVSIFLDQAISMALYRDKDSTLSDEESVSIMDGVASTAIEQMQQAPTEKSYAMTQKAAKGLRELVTKNPKALKSLFGKKSKEADLIVNHCISVCGLATKLAEHIRLPEDDIDNLATAALIHDIGIPHSPPEVATLFFQDISELSGEQKYEYFKHTKASSELLNSKPFISVKVEELVQNHEENCQGTGPYKLAKLSPLQECLNLVNAFDKRILSRNEPPAQAFKAFQIDWIGMYSLELIKHFGIVLKQEGLLET